MKQKGSAAPTPHLCPVSGLTCAGKGKGGCWPPYTPFTRDCPAYAAPMPLPFVAGWAYASPAAAASNLDKKGRADNYCFC